MRNRLALSGAALALLTPAACWDGDAPTAPLDVLDPPAPQVVQCRANIDAGTVACGQPTLGTPAGLQLAVVVGGQGTYVQLASTNVSYDGSDVFQADVTVQNLIAQPMGTPDGTTVTGIKVFFHTGPDVTSGTGTVTVANADGTGTFTGAVQPYFEYSEILQTNDVSAAKTWLWSVSPTVETFAFSVYVSTDIPVVPGEWEATPTPAFGTVDFTVNAQSSAITLIWFHFDNYMCGSAPFSGSVGFGSTWPITDRQFNIDHTDPMGTRFVFGGTFTTLGDEASGTWQLTRSGSTCSGTWQGAPANAEPTATISSPSDWDSFGEGDAISFQGSGSDP
jgi:hypothetical protein